MALPPDSLDRRKFLAGMTAALAAAPALPALAEMLPIAEASSWVVGVDFGANDSVTFVYGVTGSMKSFILPVAVIDNNDPSSVAEIEATVEEWSRRMELRMFNALCGPWRSPEPSRGAACTCPSSAVIHARGCPCGLV